VHLFRMDPKAQTSWNCGKWRRERKATVRPLTVTHQYGGGSLNRPTLPLLGEGKKRTVRSCCSRHPVNRILKQGKNQKLLVICLERKSKWWKKTKTNREPRLGSNLKRDAHPTRGRKVTRFSKEPSTCRKKEKKTCSPWTALKDRR